MHIDNPTGNISYKEAKKIAENRFVGSAIPISIGDNYKGYKLVGTVPEYIELQKARLAQGRLFTKSFEVVIGSAVAKSLNLIIGDTFSSAHGLIENAIEEHSENPLKVVGILAPTQNVIDRLIVLDLESIWHMHEHHEGSAEIHEHENDEVTALLVKFKNKMGLLQLPRVINENTNFQAALPKYELDKLFQFTAIATQAISWIALAILLVSGISIFISLYRMVLERSKELALIRTYGGSRTMLILLVFAEGLLIGVLSFGVGILIASIGLQAVFTAVEETYKQQIYLLNYSQDLLELGLFTFALIVFATAIAIIPIFKMDISKILSNEK